MLSGSTKSYKSYGKRKTNTTNKLTTTLWLDSPPPIPTKSTTGAHLSLSSSDSDDSDSNDSAPPPPPKLQPKELRKTALANLKARRAGPSTSIDKENVAAVPSPRRPAGRPLFTAKPRNRIVSHSPVASRTSNISKPSKGKQVETINISSGDDRDGDEAEAEELSPPPVRRRAGEFLGVHIPSRTSLSREVDLSEESEDVPLRPRRKVRVTSRRKVILSESSESSAVESVLTRKDLRRKSAEKKKESVAEGTDSSVIVVEPSVRRTRTSRAVNTSTEEIDQLEEEEEVPVFEDPEGLEEVDQLDSDTDDLSVRPPIASSCHTFPSLLSPLLSSSSNTLSAPYDFSSFVRAPPAPFAACSFASPATWRKIGEASYSEVFSSVGEDGEEMVIKVIPVAARELAKGEEVEDGLDEEMPYMSDWSSVTREIAVSGLVGGATAEEGVSGFVGFRGAFIVQGSYPEHLLSSWDAFKRVQSPPCDEQIRPDVLPDTQVYAIVCLAHAGSDLETYKLKSWREAASVLWQVSETCAAAEQSIEFEHRDMHWGNVLIRPSSSSSSLEKDLAALTITPKKKSGRGLASPPFDPSAEHGVEVTLIDFTLSRARDSSGVVLFDPFEDECMFEGDGDHQFDVYRLMRTLVGDDWEGFHPLTNLMWLHYLTVKLLTCKTLRAPPLAPSPLITASPAIGSPFRPRTATRSSASTSFAPSRRARTLPNPASLRTAAEERKAWEMLKTIEERLKSVVDGVSEKKAKKGGKKKGGKGSATSGGGEEWKSASEFFEWWDDERMRM